MTGNPRPLNLIQLRRAAQVLFFLLWYYIFFRTYVAADNVIHRNPVPDLFLKTDPLAGLLSSAASRAFVHELVWWLPMVALTLLAGRWFCGWVCPLGTWLDLYDRVNRRLKGFFFREHDARGLVRNSPSTFRRLTHWKYLLLAALIVSALLSVSLAGFTDPLCILVRAFSFSLAPLLGQAEHLVRGKTVIFGYGFTVPHFFKYNLFAGVCFVFILWLNRYGRRFWCRTLCPLGALYGILGRFSFVKVRVDPQSCNSCLLCATGCKMGALDFPEAKAPVSGCRADECVRCYGCVDVCPKNSVSVRWALPSLSATAPHGRKAHEDGHDRVTRRRLIKAMMAGAVLAPAARLDPVSRLTKSGEMLRPPFARVNDAEFMSICVRCGLCVQACKTNTLQPICWDAGVEGFMTPVISPEIAGCHGECTACGAVCPTNAILPFTPAEKHTIKMGTAKLELDRCVAWTENCKCSACVGVCPTLAVKETLDKGIYKPVRISAAECTGCGLCVARCNQIVTNNSACVVTARGRGVPTDFAAIQKNWEKQKSRKA